VSIRTLTQEDPIGLAGGLNLYGFAGGDPINFSDPFGLCTGPWCLFMVGRMAAGRIQSNMAGDVAASMGEWTYTQFYSPYSPSKSPEANVGDCMDLVEQTYSRAGIDVPYVATSEIANSDAYRSVSGDQIRRGDTWVGGKHGGIVLGVTENGAQARVMQNGGSPGSRDLTLRGVGYEDRPTRTMLVDIKGSKFYRPKQIQN